MDSRDLVAFGDSTFEPVFKHSELVALLEFFDKRLVGLRAKLASDLLKNDLDLSFFALLVNKSSEHNRGGQGIHLIEEDLDVVQEVVLVKISSELFDEVMDITEINEWLRVRKTESLEEVLDLNGVVAVLFFLNDLVDYEELIALGGSFNVLEVDFLVFGIADDLTEEHEDTVERSNGFEALDSVLDGEILVVLNSCFDDNSEILSVVTEEI